MREFYMVSPTIWLKLKKFPDVAKLTYVYLWTSRHQTSVGACYLPMHYGASDLGWPNRKFSGAIAWLLERDEIVRDGDTEEVFIRDWFLVNAPRSANHYKGAIREAGMLQSSNVRMAVASSLKEELGKRETPKWMAEVDADRFPNPNEVVELAESNSL